MASFHECIVLYFDMASGMARAAATPTGVDVDSEQLALNGVRYVRRSTDLFFWDYLVLANGDIVGVVLVDFDDEGLARSRLLSASANVHRNEYGYFVRLVQPDADPDIDSAQAFGCEVYQNGPDHVVMLPDWHERGYAFPLDVGLIEPPSV